MKTALVLGAGGFIGSHLVKRLKSEGYFVRGIDLKYPEFSKTEADEFFLLDLRSFDSPIYFNLRTGDFDEVYQLAADMGGCQFVFTGEHDADIMHNSALINLNVCNFFKDTKSKVFYSSSACMYPQGLQDSTYNQGLKESDAYPADPDSEYGWEKLFSERLYLAYARNYGLNIRIARFHNIYGPEGTYKGGREKAPASICRKVITRDGSFVNVWGDGLQTRSFLYIDDCIDSVRLLMETDYKEPVNIGSEESVTILKLWQTAIAITEKDIEIRHIDRPNKVLGVLGRNSDNTLARQVLGGWEPKYSLREGLEKTYWWIKSQYEK